MLDPLVRNNVLLAGNVTARKSIVFVNGLGYNQSFWEQIAEPFSKDFKLVFFDHAGSIEENQPYFYCNESRYLNVSGYAADLLEVSAALELNDEVILVGHSLGAMAALLAVVQQPVRFSRLIMIGASPRYANTSDYYGGFTKDDINEVYQSIERNYSDWLKNLASISLATPENSLLIRRFEETLAHVPQKMMLTVLCSILQADHRASLSKVCTPTLIIQSQDDYFVPMEVANYLQRQIPGSRLTVIDAKGHLPHVSAPEKVIAAIKDFLN